MSIVLFSVQRNLDILGLKTLHDILLETGHDARLVYLPRLREDEPGALHGLDAFLLEAKPTLFGVSVMALDYHHAVALTRHLKKTFPETPVVWGGIHATTAPEMCARHADYVCIGEGEHTMVELAKAAEGSHRTHKAPVIASGAKQSPDPYWVRRRDTGGGLLRSARNDGWGRIDAIPNLCYLDQGVLKRNPLHPLLDDLDRLPPARQISPSSFIQIGNRVVPLESRHLRAMKRYRGSVYKILTSRGCPYSCTYCANNALRNLYGTWNIRRRSVEHVLAELERARHEKARSEAVRLEYIDFSDDCFMAADMDYLRAFCREYKKRIALPFIVKGTPRYFVREKLDLLADAGLAWVNLGLQSGSDRVCGEVYGRRIASEEFLSAARLINEYSVAAYYDVIVDNPYERAEESLETVEVLLRTPRPFYTLIFSLSAYYGTELHARFARDFPERADEALGKDYRFREKNATTVLIEMAGVLHRPVMKALVRIFRRRPNALTTRAALHAARLYTTSVLLPLTYFRLILRTQKGSFWRALRVLPVYLHGGLTYHANNFDWFKTLMRRRRR